MLPKLLVIALLIAILVALAFGAVFLVKDPSSRSRTLKALTWRVGLQAALVAFLALAIHMGWIHPHGIGIEP